MARTVHIRFTGRAEAFLKEMREKHNLSELDVIGKGLGLLEIAVTTGRVAMMRAGYTERTEGVEYFFDLLGTDGTKREAVSVRNRDEGNGSPAPPNVSNGGLM